jgi:ABC-type transport system involved in cytochrome bd biosynthesis fused ATPase/permease subunit
MIWIFACCYVFYFRTRHVEGALYICTAILLAALLVVIIFGFPMVIFWKFNRLMKQGNYYRAKKYFDKYQHVVRGEDQLLELKGRLRKVSQSQMAESKAQDCTMARVLKVFAYIWFGLFGTLLVTSCISYIFKKGFRTFAQGWTPFGILSFPLLFFPGIASLLLAKWLEKNKSAPKP